MKKITINIPTKDDDVNFEETVDRIVRASFGKWQGFGANNLEAFDDLLTNLPTGKEFNEHRFPNGFSNWHETHYFISTHIAAIENNEGSVAYRRRAEQGIGGLWELAQELTDEFETLHEGRQWDGEWMDELEDWLITRDNNLSSVQNGSRQVTVVSSASFGAILDALISLYYAVLNHATVEVLEDHDICKCMDASLMIIQQFDVNQRNSESVT